MWIRVTQENPLGGCLTVIIVGIGGLLVLSEVLVGMGNKMQSDSASNSSYSSSAVSPAPPEDYNPQTVKLSDLTAFNSSDYRGSAFTVESINDNLENAHGKSLVTKFDSSGYNQYYLNKQYLEFSGIVFLSEKSKSSNYENIIEFVGDGNTLATFSFTGGVLPKDFLLDVTGVEVLEINYSANVSGMYVGIDATLKKPDLPAEENPENGAGEETAE